MKFPLGIQTFAELRDENYVYVDKTQLIYELVSKGKIYFLSRPRRFGKSLLISTFETLFNGHKSLFDGLSISQTDYDFNEYAVITIEFAKEEFASADNLRDFLFHQVEYYAQIFGIGLTRSTYVQRFDELITKIHQQLNKKVVLLIDEYDRPFLNNLGSDVLPEIKGVMSTYYSAVKSLDKHLKFIFITGVSKFAKLSVFSGMNSLTDISMDSRYAGICGVTHDELLAYFDEPIKALIQKDGLSFEGELAKIKYWYNGYLFEETAKPIYNPYSLLCLFDKLKYDSYWFATGTPTFLLDLIKIQQFDLGQLSHFEVDSSAFMSVEPENINPLTALLQSGYLTIGGFKDGWYLLKFPNYEVEYSFNHAVVETFSNNGMGVNLGYIRKLSKALQDNDIDVFIEQLKVFFANIPYDITLKQEKYYQSLFYAIFVLLGFQIETEVRTNKGRIDCVVQTDNNIYVIEFKLNGSREQALAQIKDKQYAQKYSQSKKSLVLLGVDFDSEQRNIGDYIVEHWFTT